MRTPLSPGERRGGAIASPRKSTGPGPVAFSLSLALSSLLAHPGCSARLSGPRLHIDAVEPRLVCPAKAGATVTLKGGGFSPVPLGAFSGTVKLAFPRIELKPATDLDGAKVEDPAIRVVDDPSAPQSSHVHFLADDQLAFDPPADLKPGIYDVLVTSPAAPDVQTATFVSGLAILPPPVIKTVDPKSGCAMQADRRVTIDGSGIMLLSDTKTCTDDSGCASNKCGDDGHCLLAPKIVFTGTDQTPHEFAPTFFSCAPVASGAIPGLQQCNEISFTKKMGDLAEGAYNVTVVNPAPIDCPSNALPYTASAAPKITSITPAKICPDGSAADLSFTNPMGFSYPFAFTIKGSGFAMGARVSLGGRAATQFKVDKETQITAFFWDMAPNAMDYTPNMSYPLDIEVDDCKATSTPPVAVTGTAGPALFFVDPPIVLSSIPMPISIYASAIQSNAAGLFLLSTKPMSTTLIPLPTTVDANHPNRLLATVPVAAKLSGDYDIWVFDGSGCKTVIPAGLKVAGAPGLTISAVSPNFGGKAAGATITITAADGLKPTPHVYLTAKGGATTVELGGVSWLSATQITAVVPPGLDPAGSPYSLAVMNADGTSGVLAAAYSSNTNAPPRVDGVSPGAMPADYNKLITIRGANFRMGATVSFSCSNGINIANTNVQAMQADRAIIIDTPAPIALLPPGTTCTARVTNVDDKGWGEAIGALAISGANGTPAGVKSGPDLNVARRAPGLAAANSTPYARWLYAIGGDAGTAAGALDTVESTTMGGAGPGGAWTQQRNKLLAKRTLAGLSALGRYLYLVGGNDGAAPLASVERAMVLDPQRTPTIDVDIKPGGGAGLGGGTWIYRIAAIQDGADANNPGGESLASPPAVVRVPDLADKVQVVLGITKLAGATGYRVYRTPTADLAAGKEVLIDTIGDVASWTDDGTKMAGAATPLAEGSTGAWHRLGLPTLGTARESPSVALAADPSTQGTYYLYAIAGRDGQGSPLATYEYLTITVAMDGTQTFSKTWQAGGQKLATARFQAAVYVATNDANPNVPANTPYLYVAGGTDGQATVGTVEYAIISAGGDLGAFTSAGATIDSFGFGAVAAGNNLFAFGGGPSKTIAVGAIGMSPAVTGFTALMAPTLSTPRYLPGCVLMGPLVFLAGGSDNGVAAATKTTEWMVY